MKIESHVLTDTFAVLTPKLAVRPVGVGPDFYANLDRDFNGFKGHVLVAIHEFSENWATWEKHPAGDEIVVLLSGEADFDLQTANGIQTVRLSKSGEYVVVPKNTWHTSRVSGHCRVLFITPGEGTLNEESPEGVG